MPILILTVVVWGYNWVPLKIAASAVDPWWLSAWRVGVGALALFVVLAFKRRLAAPPPGWAFVGVALTQIAGLVAFSTLALRFGSVATVTSLIFTMPLWTALFARALLGERLSRTRMFWLLVASAGIFTVASGLRGGELIGGALATAGGASWALGNVLQRRAGYAIDLVRLIAWQQLVATLPLLLCAVALGHPVDVLHLAPGVIAAGIFAAIVGSGVAWLWWGIALSALPANTVALGSFAIPVIGTLAAALQLRALPAPLTIAGLVLVVAGLAASVRTQDLRAAAAKAG